MIGMFIVDYFQYCFLGKGGRGAKCVLFTSDCLWECFALCSRALTIRMSSGGWERGKGGWKLELICPKCSVEVPCCLVYVPKRTHAVFKSNISSDKDYIRTSFVMFFFFFLSCEYFRTGGHFCFSVQLHSRLFSS